MVYGMLIFICIIVYSCSTYILVGMWFVYVYMRVFFVELMSFTVNMEIF